MWLRRRRLKPEGEQIYRAWKAGRVSATRADTGQIESEPDMTARAFVLDALKAKGLDIRPDDLADLCKPRR